MWLRDYKEKIRRRGVTLREDEAGAASDYPPMSLNLDNAKEITIYPTHLCHLPANEHWRRRRLARCETASPGPLVVASVLSPTLYATYQREGSIKAGIYIDSSGLYVRRALTRTGAVWCLYRREGIILAAIQHHQIYSLLDLIAEEYQRRTYTYRCRCSYRSQRCTASFPRTEGLRTLPAYAPPPSSAARKPHL